MSADTERRPIAWLHDEHPTAFVITDRVKQIWLACKPKHVEHYTIPCWTARTEGEGRSTKGEEA